MTPEELVGLRSRLAEFAASMLGCLARCDQRAKGELYLRGLLTDGRRKSMQPMAQRLGVDHQRLQQFISSSTWDFAGPRRRLATWAAEAIAPVAYVVDDTGFAKDGPASACVARQYSGTLGKTANCQIGVSVHQVTNTASAASNWRLFCPASWDDALADSLVDESDPESDAEQIRVQIRARRQAAGVPDAVRHREKWRLALDMLDELIGDASNDASDDAAGGWGLPKLPVIADAGYGDATPFRLGLEQRGLDYVVAVKGETSVHPGDAQPVAPSLRKGRGRPATKPRYPDKPISLAELALEAGRSPNNNAFTEITWRQGTKKTKGNPTATMTSRFALLPVRPANRNNPRGPDGSLPLKLALVEWPDDEPEPTGYWLTNLPTDTPIEHIVDLAKIRWRIEHDYRELKTGLGLDHFEGRTWTGWNRHVTLVTIAQAFITMLRLDPKAAAPA